MSEDTILSEPVATPDEQSNVSSFWINDTTGNPSMSATFATIAFFVTTAIYVASIFEKIGPVSIRPFDSGAASAYLIPVLGLYFGRRWTTDVGGK
jgi:hypothetical protein